MIWRWMGNFLATRGVGSVLKVWGSSIGIAILREREMREWEMYPSREKPDQTTTNWCWGMGSWFKLSNDDHFLFLTFPVMTLGSAFTPVSVSPAGNWVSKNPAHFLYSSLRSSTGYLSPELLFRHQVTSLSCEWVKGTTWNTSIDPQLAPP